MRLRFYIGGFTGPSYDVVSDGPTIVYTSRDDPAEHRITPSAAQRAAFGRAIEKAGVWRWAPDYCNPGVCDGTQWSIEIADGKRELASSGSNAEPEGFASFLRALRRLLGGLPIG